MKRLILTIIVFSSLIYITGCKDKIEDPQNGHFVGVVTDTLGNPIDSVNVLTFPPHMSTLTGEDGSFDLVAFPRTYRIIFRKGKKVYITWVDTLPDGEIDTMEKRLDVITSVETLSPVIDTVDSFVLRITLKRTTVDTNIYKTVKSNLIDISPGENYNFGIVEMETTFRRIVKIDTIGIDTLK